MLWPEYLVLWKIDVRILLLLSLILFQVIPTKKFRGFGMAKFLKDHMNVDK